MDVFKYAKIILAPAWFCKSYVLLIYLVTPLLLIWFHVTEVNQKSQCIDQSRKLQGNWVHDQITQAVLGKAVVLTN